MQANGRALALLFALVLATRGNCLAQDTPPIAAGGNTTPSDSRPDRSPNQVLDPVVDSTSAGRIRPNGKSHLKRLPQVAVLSFTGTGVDASDLSAITNRFEAELLSSDSFKIVERRNIDKILREQGFQQTGACDNSECSVEIGQLLSVQGIFTGELSKVGGTWSLSVKRTDVGSGQTDFSQVLDIQGGVEDVLRGGVPEMALIASGRKKPDARHAVMIAKSTNFWPWLAGGAVVLGGGAVAVVLLRGGGSGPTTSTRDVSIQLVTGR